MIKRPLIPTMLIAALCVCASAAEAGEVKVTLESLPLEVVKALKEHAGTGKIQSVSKESENGITVYEASFNRKGRAHDLTVDESGKLVSDEEVIPPSELPETIQKAIKREHPDGKIDKLEKISEGRKTSYEALISEKGKREEIKFVEKGKVLEREDKMGWKAKE